MKKYLSFAITAIMCAASAMGASNGTWRLHTPFGDRPTVIADTPDRTYFMSLAQVHNADVPSNREPLTTIFVFDKEGDELRPLNSQNLLSENVARTMAYNPHRNYLLVVYENFNIDLVFDSGKVVNIPALRDVSISGSKEVGAITFDYDLPRAYLATDFGYIIINDDKGEILESRNYGKPIGSMARMDDRILLAMDGKLLQAPVSAPRYSLDEFTPVEGSDGVTRVLPLSDKQAAILCPQAEEKALRLVWRNGAGDFRIGGPLMPVADSNFSANRDGYFITVPAWVNQLRRDGTVTRQLRRADYGMLAGSWDFKEFWFGDIYKGFWSKKMELTDDQNGDWTITRNAMIPDAPAIFMTDNLAYSPKYGVLANNRGVRPYLTSGGLRSPILLSGYKDQSWTMHGLPYTNPDMQDIFYNPAGIAIDPDNPDVIYMGSYTKGLLRMDLQNPDDLLHLSHPSDAASNRPGFIVVRPDDPGWNVCRFSTPRFDTQGNLWSSNYVYSSKDGENQEVWLWTADARRATKSPESYSPWKSWIINGLKPRQCEIFPLDAHRNLILLAPNGGEQVLAIIDTRGTLATEEDDNVAIMPKGAKDQDGSTVGIEVISTVYDDPTTGLVWVGHRSGLFTINPTTLFNDPSRINRIKVARNDGTSLADYLLDGVNVTDIMADSKGRKWFATLGGGVVVTSRDGREILFSLTTDNSEIPSNDVYKLCYDPSSNSVMMATSLSLAQFYPAGDASAGDTLSSVRAYPNPVRPDYYGWVTIDGLTDGAVVKIADSAGNVVRDLGRTSGGAVEWDASGADGRRVASGVYHVLASSGPDDKAMGAVASILVMK